MSFQKNLFSIIGFLLFNSIIVLSQDDIILRSSLMSINSRNIKINKITQDSIYYSIGKKNYSSNINGIIAYAYNVFQVGDIDHSYFGTYSEDYVLPNPCDSVYVIMTGRVLKKVTITEYFLKKYQIDSLDNQSSEYVIEFRKIVKNKYIHLKRKRRFYCIIKNDPYFRKFRSKCLAVEPDKVVFSIRDYNANMRYYSIPLSDITTIGIETPPMKILSIFTTIITFSMTRVFYHFPYYRKIDISEKWTYSFIENNQ